MAPSAAPAPTVRTLADFPAMLGRLRRARGLSQLGLALAADVSQRHISFLETSRTRPSRDMVGRLSAALDLALKDENALLLAAGFAPAHGEHAFGDEAAANWPQLALHFVALAEAEAWRAPPGPMRAELDATLAALSALTPEGAQLHAVQPMGAALILQVRTPALSLDLVSTVAQFGAPHDTAADDLRIEFFYPADAASEAALRTLGQGRAQT